MRACAIFHLVDFWRGFVGFEGAGLVDLAWGGGSSECFGTINAG